MLLSKVPEILVFIQEQQKRIDIDAKIFSILDGNILPAVEESLSEALNKRAFKIARERIPPINLLKMISGKISKIYAKPPVRKSKDESDQEMVDLYEKELEVNVKLGTANVLVNALRRCAIDIFLENGNPKIRIIPAHQFLVYNWDAVNPMKVDCFIKFGGVRIKKINNKDTVTPVYYLYSDKEFLIVDKDMEIVTELMTDSSGKPLPLNSLGTVNNPYGRIPFVYVTNSDLQLLPDPNEDDLKMSILPLVLLCDLNYAVKYMSHSIIYTINVDDEKLEMNPDTIVSMKSRDDDLGKEPKIGQIKPEVDVEKVLKLIFAQMGLYLESKNLKVKMPDNVQSDNAQSGLHELVKNSDFIDEKHEQVGFFQKVEKDFWNLLSILHEKWKLSAKLDKQFNKSFSSKFGLNIFFAEIQQNFTRSELVKVLVMELDAGLTSRRMAIKELRQSLSDLEITAILKEVDEELEKKAEMKMQPKENAHNEMLKQEKLATKE